MVKSMKLTCFLTCTLLETVHSCRYKNSQHRRDTESYTDGYQSWATNPISYCLSILKPKNFTELIQSQDYCENECEINHGGIMSEAQHESCLECFTTDSMIQTILSDYENSVTSEWIDSAPSVSEIKQCVEKYIPSIMPSGSSCLQNGKCEMNGNGNNPSESNGVISVPTVYKERGYDWWGIRLQANCTIKSFSISNGFILEANDMMVLVSQRSDQIQDNNTDLIINPTFDPSQSDCAFSTELDKNVNSPILVQLNQVQVGSDDDESPENSDSQNGILDIAWDGNAWSIFNEIDETSQHMIAFKTPPCQIQNMSLSSDFRSDPATIETDENGTEYLVPIPSSRSPNTEQFLVSTQFGCNVTAFQIISDMDLSEEAKTPSEPESLQSGGGERNPAPLDTGKCIVSTNEDGNVPCVELNFTSVVDKKVGKSSNAEANVIKTLINKANRVLVQHSDDAEFCPGFQSCEYNIKFQQSHSDVNKWEMTIQSGCTQSTQYTSQETACLIANNEEYFSQFNIKTYALETKQKKQFSSYSKDEQNLKVSVQKKPCDNLNNAKCVQIDGRKQIKDLVDESYHMTQN